MPRSKEAENRPSSYDGSVDCCYVHTVTLTSLMTVNNMKAPRKHRGAFKSLDSVLGRRITYFSVFSLTVLTAGTSLLAPAFDFFLRGYTNLLWLDFNILRKINFKDALVKIRRYFVHVYNRRNYYRSGETAIRGFVIIISLFLDLGFQLVSHLPQPAYRLRPRHLHPLHALRAVRLWQRIYLSLPRRVLPVPILLYCQISLSKVTGRKG